MFQRKLLLNFLSNALLFSAAAANFSINIAAQRIAVIAPENDQFVRAFAEKLEDALSGRIRILDHDAALAAYRSLKIQTPFNLTSEQAKRIGDVIGCDSFLIVKAETTRRTSSQRPEYYESFASIFLIDGKAGRLNLWRHESVHGNTAAEAEKLLLERVAALADAIMGFSKNSPPSPASQIEFIEFNEDIKTMRPAMPYKRIKPEYTQAAYFYGIAATVDAEVSVDISGEIKRIDIVRWAGYGLDESVIAAIRQMNWRPGEQNGRPLPMRVLLRYNFTKIEKEQ